MRTQLVPLMVLQVSEGKGVAAAAAAVEAAGEEEEDGVVGFLMRLSSLSMGEDTSSPLFLFLCG